MEPKSDDQMRADGEKIIFWLITTEDYAELRKNDGCESLANITAVQKDTAWMKKSIEFLGVSEDNLYIDHQPTSKDLADTYKKIYKKSKGYDKEKQPHTIIVYCGGHGATMSSGECEQQLYLLNTDKRNSQGESEAIFQMEFKLRYLVQPDSSFGRVCALYDCCRESLRNFKGLDITPKPK